MLAVTWALVVLPALAAADTPFAGTFFGGCAGDTAVDQWSKGNQQAIANAGAYSIVYRDGTWTETGNTCPKLLLNAPGGTYLYTYKEGGVDKNITGPLVYSNGNFVLKNMKTGHLGADCGWFATQCDVSMHASFSNANILQLVASRGVIFPFCTRNTYTLVPPTASASNCQVC